MAQILQTLGDAIGKLNSLYNGSSTAPTAGSEDYIVWTDFFNIGINLWESEEGVLWKELFVRLVDAPDGTKTTTAGTYSYSIPALFQFPASGYVWLGSSNNKVPFKIIDETDLQLFENDLGNWCYFLTGATPTLEFNPNCTMPTGYTISYDYYKFATAVSASTDKFEIERPNVCGLLHSIRT